VLFLRGRGPVSDFSAARGCVCVCRIPTNDKIFGCVYAQHDQDDDREMEGAHALPMHHKHDVHSVAFVAGVGTLRAAVLTCVGRARGGVGDNISLHSSLSVAGSPLLLFTTSLLRREEHRVPLSAMPNVRVSFVVSTSDLHDVSCVSAFLPLFTYVGACTLSLSLSRRARPVHILSPLPHHPLLHTRRYARLRAHKYPSFAHFFAQDLDIDNIIARLLEGE
jgi:hypothetical protein